MNILVQACRNDLDAVQIGIFMYISTTFLSTGYDIAVAVLRYGTCSSWCYVCLTYVDRNLSTLIGLLHSVAQVLTKVCRCG